MEETIGQLLEEERKSLSTYHGPSISYAMFDDLTSLTNTLATVQMNMYYVENMLVENSNNRAHWSYLTDRDAWNLWS